MYQVDSQAFQSLEIPPEKVDLWNGVKNEYIAHKSVKTRKIKMWNNRLQSTKLNKETVRGVSILHLSDMVKDAEKDLCSEMSVFKSLVTSVTDFLDSTLLQNSEENLTNFNIVMESIDTVATEYVTDIIQCLHVLGDTYLVVEEKETSIPVSPALEPTSAPRHKYIDRSNLKPTFLSTDFTPY